MQRLDRVFALLEDLGAKRVGERPASDSTAEVLWRLGERTIAIRLAAENAIRVDEIIECSVSVDRVLDAIASVHARDIADRERTSAQGG